MANEIIILKVYEKRSASCGNIFRAVYNDGSDVGYPSAEVRDRAIQAVADSHRKERV